MSADVTSAPPSRHLVKNGQKDDTKDDIRLAILFYDIKLNSVAASVSVLSFRLMTHPMRFFYFFAVLADFLKSAAVGAPLLPAFLIFSPLPALIRFRLA